MNGKLKSEAAFVASKMRTTIAVNVTGFGWLHVVARRASKPMDVFGLPDDAGKNKILTKRLQPK